MPSHDRDRTEPGARSSRSLGRDEPAPVDPTDRHAGVAEARRRFGGIDIPATLVGMLTALALVVLLGGIVGAIVGGIGFQTGLEAKEELSIGGLIGGLITLAVAYFIGGWTAGRIARYDGGSNGLMTAVWAILLAALLALFGVWLGAEYNVLERLNVPQWFSSNAFTTGAIVSGIVAIIIMLVAGFLGGKRGERYHRRADAAIAATKEGGIVRPATGPDPQDRRPTSG